MNFKVILINLFANPNTNEPVRLEKQTNKTSRYERIHLYIKFIIVLIDVLLDFIYRNFYFILTTLAFIVFILGIFYLTGLSATDSGLLYNNLDKVI